MKQLCIFVLPVILGSTSKAEWGPVGVYSSYYQTPSTFSTGNTSLNYSGSPTSGYGAGLVGIYPLGSSVSLELRALYVNEGMNGSISGTYNGQTLTASSVQTAPFFEFPILFDFNLGSKFAIHGGGFYSLATGNISTNINETYAGSNISSNGSSSNTVNDYGVIGGLEFKTEISQTTDLFISVDYLYGLANQEAGQSNFTANYSRAIQGIVGFLFRP